MNNYYPNLIFGFFLLNH